ncbi:hypothetical protein EV359DRAFT_86393 [Lentinula novae-zelandiae]|nr:hypothetical protein EV359DRAFT_86393 [Lentinula novae-zelandiae]
MNITSEVVEAKNQKRRPERSKGTGKKVKETIIPPKRPVGRPRKDGLPSGSATVRPQWFILHPVKDDDWGEFSQNEPDIFLSSLVVALSALSSPTPSGPSAEETFSAVLYLENFLAPHFPRVLLTDSFNISKGDLMSIVLLPGRIKQGPLKIYDVERPFFIIGAEYVCEKEGRRFTSTDPSILRALPGKLRDELPVRLVHVHKDVGCDENVWCWKPAGVSKTLWNLVSGCLKSGLQKDTIVELIKAVQKDQLQVVELSKLSNLDVGLTPEADKCVWTTNTAPAHEDNDTQELYPLTQSFDSHDHMTTVFFPSNSIRSEPENSLVGIVTQTQLPGGQRNHVLNDTTIHEDSIIGFRPRS